MQSRIKLALMFSGVFALIGGALSMAQPTPGANRTLPRPQGPCDIYAAAGDPCVAAHSTTRSLYAAYNGPLYQVLRQSDGKTLDIGVVQPIASPTPDPGGYANAAAQDAFCANTYCWISKLYDQSPQHNDLIQAPRGGFSGPALGGFDNLPVADLAPITIMGHKVYGVFIAPGMGLRQNDAKGTAVDDQAEGQYWVINGQHYNSGCCFDYGNAEIDSHDDDNGTMETAYFGNSSSWYHGTPPGPWVMTDQENNLVGCVNPDGSKLCANLPIATSRFVTAMAKGESHHWTSMGGDSQQGALSVMFDGPRINSSYDPMRKQGAILLGNGGDNGNNSQGTFYEGAMTASGTFPTDATDQLVQANVVAAGYAVQPVILAPASSIAAPPGLQTFSPGSSQDTIVTFTNTTATAAADVELHISMPSKQWTSVVSGTTHTSKTFGEPVAPGSTVSATFKVTSGPAAFNGDLIGSASWANSSGNKRTETIAEKVRNVSPIKLNEIRISSGPPTNTTDSFIELFNAGSSSVDLSSWTLTEHSSQMAISSTVKVPIGTKLAAGGFYLLGLSNSGLAIPARPGDAAINVRSTTGMSAGDTVSIDTGSNAEIRKIAKVGTAASVNTTVWQPVPESGSVAPVITIPVGSTSVPVASVSGFVVGEKIAIGYGATYPSVARDVEKYEVATVTAVGNPGTQAYLASDAPAGATNIQVSSLAANTQITSLANISIGDRISLDIDSPGHGIETVTVAKVGTPASRTTLVLDATIGATNVKVRSATGFLVGDKMTVGTPTNQKAYTITAVGKQGSTGTGIDFAPAFAESHANGESAVVLGTGLDLAAPLKFNHAANLPFSNQGTGISFQPATAFPHTSNEPVQALGTGITLDRPVTKRHAIDAVVHDSTVTTAGYQGTPEPDQWFGGPALSTSYISFDKLVSIRAGSLVLHDGSGLVVDSLNYGLLVDPWASEGYQATSGTREAGCLVNAPGPGTGFGSVVSADGASNTSSGRFPDGHDSDSNCKDFMTSPTTTLSGPTAIGVTNIKVASVGGFDEGETISIDNGASLETAVITTVGTAGGTAASAATTVGATVIPVASTVGFSSGQIITIDDGANSETAVVNYFTRRGAGLITLTAPLTLAHAARAQVSGSGITLASALTHVHVNAAQVAGDASTPGAPNHYYRRFE
jgi:hypothetical protein